jgi:hypothetical protein
MQHYSLEDWTDFARNVAAKGKKAEMQSHLDTGCKPCTKVYSMWQRVSEAAHREAAYEPPRDAVQTVKGLGVIHGLGRAPKKSLNLVQLLFDSFQAPVQAGVRSSAATARQLLYGAGNYRIDLRMEPQADSEKVALVGQVLNAVDPSPTSAPIPVVLFKGSKILSVSRTNSFGEFHLECDLDSDLKLHFRIPSEMEVWIPLVDPARSAAPEPADPTGVKGLIEKVKKKGTKGKA